MTQNELTEHNFWDQYWQNCKIPATVNLQMAYDRCIVKALRKYIPKAQPGAEAIEIGCAPGKWLAFFKNELDYKPNGIDYSVQGMKTTIDNLKLLGIDPGVVTAGDFFELTPQRQYDVVMSYGFIEHFTDVDDVVDRHLKWLKPGGVLVLAVPNFRGVYYLMQKILDHTILDKHNLDIMRLQYFRQLAEKFTLHPIFLKYVGSFEPVLPIGSQEPPNPLQFMVNVFLQVTLRIRKLRLFDYINNPLFSSCILAIYRKPGSEV